MPVNLLGSGLPTGEPTSLKEIPRSAPLPARQRSRMVCERTQEAAAKRAAAKEAPAKAAPAKLAAEKAAKEVTKMQFQAVGRGGKANIRNRAANFDEDVFDDPFTFNILRNPNPHVGFGGTGARYCIGTKLARMTIDLMFNAIADHMPDLMPISKPERLRSGWLNGIKHW